MELFWYIVLLSMLAIYVVLDGYDFGVGIIHLFFAKKEKDKKILKNAIGPFWDANEVWLIASGGVLFFAFPLVYASSFSGFYLPLIMILWLLIFRAIGLEFRGQLNNQLWFKIWDTAFGVSSFLLALFFGLALGNVVRGVNLGGVENGIAKYDESYFFLPLWNSSLNPHAESLGIIDWFTLLLGLISLLIITIHGANWLIFKTNCSFKEKLKNYILYWNSGLVLLTIIGIITWHYVREFPFDNFNKNPILWIVPLISIFSMLMLFRIKKFKKESTGFIYSSLFIIASFFSTAIAMFPDILPSSNNMHEPLTVYNSAAPHYGLMIGSYWWIFAIILVMVYVFVQYKIFRGKLDGINYGEH
ncbi:cytochrome d ubiquinol oxidase subunit II [Aureivirga sp. CE67]|uniref:cytochrome d ubiquinol oxidase subunit II n=1 Tax=Aureivirga sp. CE67 TaxID=1788983 RepID=UPI0018C8D8B4|nr:cytochrome d ubiquinol oxidase subunit II [Aureivirga sp. CE67]